jgi:addiction module RelE/StbE family toxin
MDYQISWDDEAIKELGQIVHYISQVNPAAGRKIGELMLEKIELLGAFPQLGKTLQNLKREEVREFPVPPYRIIYHVKDLEKSVRILKIWHGARWGGQLDTVLGWLFFNRSQGLKAKYENEHLTPALSPFCYRKTRRGRHAPSVFLNHATYHSWSQTRTVSRCTPRREPEIK